jgi:hypothetical protein
MATGKRFYWMKLKDTFMTSDAVDFLMGQPNGANYVVLYQMLCLKTINTGGKLSRQIGEIIIPYDEQKIARDCKWFSVDTVRIALELYKALGLIYQDVDGSLVLVDHKNLVGSETDYAERNRRLRANQRAELPEHNVYSDVYSDEYSDVCIENRDKDNRDKISDINNNYKEKNSKKEKVSKFVPPTLEEVVEYCNSRNSPVNPKYFFEYFEAGHWIDSKGQQVLNWKQKLLTWERKGENHDTKSNSSNGGQGGKHDWEGLNFYSN